MIGVWMTPCKNGQCELSIRRDGINKIVIASQTPLTDAQAEELFWCICAMQRSGKTLKDLLKDEEQKTSGSWKFVCHNPSYSPFDGSPSKLYRCTNCGYTTGSMTKYCPICGSKNQP